MHIIVDVIGAGVIFAVGRKYGKTIEAKSIAEALKVEALVSEEYRTVVASIKAKVSASLATIKKYL